MATLANNGYTTVFLLGHKGLNVFHANDVNISSIAPPALQGWRDDRGLWMVHVTDKTTISQNIDIAKTEISVYELPNTKEVVRFLHAALGTPTRATLLTASHFPA